jgi:osmotically-inducible protein OsmY
MTLRCCVMLIGPCLVCIGCARSDPGITANVKTLLVADDLVRARHIDVETNDRTVTLRGQVASVAEEARALEIARATAGVANVIDRIEIVRESTAPTSGVFELPGAPAAIDSGTVPTRADSSLVVELIRRTDGVTQVIDRTIVAPENR